MTKVELKYNPFTHERLFQVDGKPSDLPRCWGDDGSRELSEWCGSFFKAVKDKFNDSQMEIHFKGIPRDFEFLSDALKQHLADNSDDDIDLKDDGCVNTNTKLSELQRLFDEMQRESPFPVLKEKSIKDVFDKAMSDEFEMAVVATMSSGKSTLINSMLGRELLPALNKATTATLARIHDIDEMKGKGFKGTSYSSDGHPIKSCNPLTLDVMKEMNADPITFRIEIEGDIGGVESRDMKLVLTDTPGPNNSKKGEGERHKAHTDRLLQADYKPMILYVLDSGKLEDDSDNILLNNVAKAMMTGGRQAQERFLFIMNKADVFDPGKGESVPWIINNAKKYLKDHGIENARIFPVSALTAKVIRQHLNKDTCLTIHEKRRVLSQYEYFVEDESLHMSDFAPLSASARERLNKKLALARDSNDEESGYAEALIYTGIPAVEIAISEYLAKYALPAKIAEGVHSFKAKIDSLGVEAEATAKLKKDKAEVNKLKDELDKLSDLIEKGEKAKALNDKINAFSSEEIMKGLYEKARKDCQTQINAFMIDKARNGVTPEEAEKWSRDLKKVLENNRTTLINACEEALNKTIKGQAEAAVKEYEKYLTALVGDVTHSSKDAILGAEARMSVEESLDAFTKEVVVGHRQVEQDGVRGKLKRLAGKLFNTDWGYDTVAVRGDRVDFAMYLQEKVKPEIEKFYISTRKVAFDEAAAVEREFKIFYKGKLQELDKKLKTKVAEKSENLSSSEKLERMIEDNEKKLNWLKGFKNRLDAVLAI